MADRSDRDKYYNKYVRDPAAQAFYESVEWRGRHGARTIKMQRSPACERCLIVAPAMVHHVIPIDTPEGWERRLLQEGLRALCWPCHAKTHAEMDRPSVNFITGQLAPVDDDQFHYVEDRGTSIERFSRKYCRHYRGRELRGQPFELHPIQLEFLRPTFGFVNRDTGLRRFTSLWLETGVGSGKTPVMAIIGLHDLLTTGGAQIYSVSNTFAQANYSFEAAKLFVKNSPLLTKLREARKLRVTRFEIIYTPLDARWNIISGEGSKAGAACSTLLLDEVHQIEDRSVYDDIQGRMTKSDQPLVVYATNAAKNPQSLYGDLHEMAEHTLAGGKRCNRRMFPVVWAAPPEADPASPESWKLANKMIGVTIAEAAVKDEWDQSQGSPALEARFRLLYLGQQVSDIQRWLDLDAWDACSKPFTDQQVSGLPLYVGIDSSGGDDLLAITYVWPSIERIYARSAFWLPRVTSKKYLDKDEIRYDLWETAGDITILDDRTISIDVQQRLAGEIIALHKRKPITAVCYDRAYSEHLIEELKAAGIKCEKVGQGWGVSSGAKELDRRLKERSITLAPSGVWRFNAENACIKHDQHSNYWPVKPGATDSGYAGKRAKKIDGISALVTALTLARQHVFPKQDTSVGAWIVNLDDDGDD